LPFGNNQDLFPQNLARLNIVLIGSVPEEQRDCNYVGAIDPAMFSGQLQKKLNKQGAGAIT